MSDASKNPAHSQHQLRSELESYVLGDLLGPAGGETEELTERTVRDRYLVSVLTLSNSADSTPEMKTACKPAKQAANIIGGEDDRNAQLP